MRRRVLEWMSGVVAAALLLWIGYGALLWTMQDAMIFPAPGGISRDALDAAARELGVDTIDLQAEDGTALYAWHRRAQGDRAVLYFHGNGETVAGSHGLQAFVSRRGWDVGVVAYRGYPGSAGRPSEEGIHRDALAIWRYFTEELGIPPQKIVLHGKSLGGGVAVALAAEVQPGALVVESSFTSVEDVAREVAWAYPVGRMLRHRFRSIDRAPAVQAPVLVLHGAQDDVIRVQQGRLLARRFADADYLEAPWLGHNDSLILQFEEGRDAYLALLESVAAPPSSP